MSGGAGWQPVESVDQLLGAWALSSWVSYARVGGTISHPLGEEPVGRLTYTPSGQMTGLMARGRREAFAQPRTVSVDHESGTDAEVRQAFNDMFGYAGSYEFADGIVTHTIALCVVPGWEGVRMVRSARLDDSGRILELTTPLRTVRDREEHSVLTWQRIDGRAHVG